MTDNELKTLKDNLWHAADVLRSGKEVVDGPKVLAKFAKKNENLVIKAGLVEGKVVDAAGVKTVASLPSRDGLISMFLSCLQAPIRKFACTVKAVADSKN